MRTRVKLQCGGFLFHTMPSKQDTSIQCWIPLDRCVVFDGYRLTCSIYSMVYYFCRNSTTSTLAPGSDHFKEMNGADLAHNTFVLNPYKICYYKTTRPTTLTLKALNYFL